MRRVLRTWLASTSQSARRPLPWPPRSLDSHPASRGAVGQQRAAALRAGSSKQAPAFPESIPSSSTPSQSPPLSPSSTPKPAQSRRLPKLPFRFETGVGLFAKRQPRPFPPPFLSPPSISFSDPLSTHHEGPRRRAGPRVNGEIIRGITNGDDAVYASPYFICANDGVGAWSARPRGHAGLWSRLILHFWVAAMEEDLLLPRPANEPFEPSPVAYLQTAYEKTLEVTSGPNDCQGTTTASGAQLYFRQDEAGTEIPSLYVTNLGDCEVLVLRPSDQSIIYKTTPQWHWFDCPRQLGTNSPDTPNDIAVMDRIDLQVGDVVLAMSDGVIDNLWEHEIVESVVASMKTWDGGKLWHLPNHMHAPAKSGMSFLAEELMTAAKKIALDPYAESPYMEHAVEEGLASEGGKLDDISVVAALCVRNEDWDTK